MEYKILESNGVENENVDGAAFNNFAAGGRDGIIKGILNECSVYSPSSNSIGMSTGELIIHGFRIKITEPYLYTFNSSPDSPIRYKFVVRIDLKQDRSVSVSWGIFLEEVSLQKANLFDTENGTYVREIFRFTHSSKGIEDIVRTIDVINGATDENDSYIIQLSNDPHNFIQSAVLYEALAKMQQGKIVVLEYSGNDGFTDVNSRYLVTSAGMYGTARNLSIADEAGDTLHYQLEIGDMGDIVPKSAGNIIRIEEAIAQTQEEVAINLNNIAINSAKIENLTNSLFENEQIKVVKVEQAFTTRITADGENIIGKQNVFPTKIQGDTVACDNLIPFPYDTQSTTTKGITFTVNNDGSITINGTATGAALFVLSRNLELKGGTQYTINGGKDGVIVTSRTNPNDLSWIDSANGKSKTGTLLEGNTLNYIGLYIGNGTVVNNITVYPMFNEGTTALPYQPYFTGLKNAYFKGIKSTGKNLFDMTSVTVTSNNTTLTLEYNKIEDCLVLNGTITNSTDAVIDRQIFCALNTAIPVDSSKTYYFSNMYVSGSITSDAGKSYIFLTDTAQQYRGNEVLMSTSNTSKICSYIPEQEYNMIRVYVAVRANSTMTFTNYKFRPMVWESNANLTAYEPYKEDIYELPEAVELGKWDYIDVENKKVVRKTYELTITEEGVGPKKVPIRIRQDSTTGVWSILCPFHDNEGGRAMTAGRDGVVVAQNNICKYASITGGYENTGYTTLQLVGVSVTTVEEAKALLAANPITFAYETFANTKTTVLEEVSERYQAWKNGSETVLQGDTDNSEYGAMPTVTNEYLVRIGGENNEQTE